MSFFLNIKKLKKLTWQLSVPEFSHLTELFITWSYKRFQCFFFFELMKNFLLYFLCFIQIFKCLSTSTSMIANLKHISNSKLALVCCHLCTHFVFSLETFELNLKVFEDLKFYDSIHTRVFHLNNFKHTLI